MAMRDYTVKLKKDSPYYNLFPGGIAPVTLLATTVVTLINGDESERAACYFMDWNRVTREQQKRVLPIAAKRHNATPSTMREHIRNGGTIPIKQEEVKE
ncbi:MAG: hypothetical protein EPO24_15920 [Bacteroidetes bacterium]|nr:MAG: hypothetical protein EPO24_15920 [Bacteroidota bacterium]